MFMCSQGSFGMAGGSAIFGALLPARANPKIFISTFSYAAQEGIEQTNETVFYISIFGKSPAQGIPVPLQFIGSF